MYVLVLFLLYFYFKKKKKPFVVLDIPFFWELLYTMENKKKRKKRKRIRKAVEVHGLNVYLFIYFIFYSFIYFLFNKNFIFRICIVFVRKKNILSL